MAHITSGNDYFVKSYGSQSNNSGPSGKRMRPYRVLMRNLAEAARKYTIVLWCSDAHGNLGSNLTPKGYKKPKA